MEINNKMPVIFIGHGSPMNAIEDNDFTKSLNKLGNSLLRPDAILVVSAHWLTKGTQVNTSENPEIIYDFYGFPDELYKIKYPVFGAPDFAKETSKQISDVKETHNWGIDHGSWAVLKHIYPNADIPVFQLSIDYHKPMQYHFELGKKLKFIREKNVLIIGSGNIVHNLRLSFEKMNGNDKTPYDWAVDFDEWVKEKIITKDYQSLIDFEKLNKNASLAVPTTDHYIPMLYVLALIEKNENINFVYEGVEYGGLSMRTFLAK